MATNYSDKIKKSTGFRFNLKKQSTFFRLRQNTDYYKAGTVTISELLEVQSLYRQSRDKYVEAYTHYELKKREYLQLTGR